MWGNPMTGLRPLVREISRRDYRVDACDRLFLKPPEQSAARRATPAGEAEVEKIFGWHVAAQRAERRCERENQERDRQAEAWRRLHSADSPLLDDPEDPLCPVVDPSEPSAGASLV